MASRGDIEGLDVELQAAGAPSRWEDYRLPVELNGKSFLDVGCWEGVHCAEAIRRNAEDVVGVDLCTCPELSTNVDRYEFEFLQMDVTGDRFESLGRFDVVLCSGLLNRVSNPAGLLARLRARTEELLVVETVVTSLGDPQPMAFFQGTGVDSNDRSSWWVPNRTCLESMLEAAGFAGISTVWEADSAGDDEAEHLGRVAVHAVPQGNTDRRRLLPRRFAEMSLRGGSR